MTFSKTTWNQLLCCVISTIECTVSGAPLSLPSFPLPRKQHLYPHLKQPSSEGCTVDHPSPAQEGSPGGSFSFSNHQISPLPPDHSINTDTKHTRHPLIRKTNKENNPNNNDNQPFLFLAPSDTFLGLLRTLLACRMLSPLESKKDKTQAILEPTQ